MTLYLASAFLIIGVLLLIFYFAVLFYSNSLLAKPEKNHLRNSFGYQYYMICPMGLRLLLYILIFASIAMIMLGELFYFSSYYFISNYYICLALIFPLSSIALLLSNILSLSYYKSHLITALIGIIFFAFSCILFGLAPYFVPNTGAFNRGLTITSLALGIISLLALINPALKNWANMDKVEVDGVTYYVKPKINYLALYEWIALILTGVLAALIFTNIIITGSISLN